MVLPFLLVEAVGERGRRRLVDDAQDVEAGDAAGVLGGLALRVVEVGGDGDDGLRHLLAEIVFGGLLHLLQDEGGDLAGEYFLPSDFDPGVAVVGFDDLVGDELLVLLDHRVVAAAADQALDGEECVFGVGDGLPLGGQADDDLAVSVKATIDGVVRMPSAFSMTLGVLPSMTATHELVVPRSIPITFAIRTSLSGRPCGP